MKLSIGALPYYWTAERLHDFYAGLPERLVDTVYLGETVCSKRRALRTVEWVELARALSTRFPEVVLSTLTLVEAESELATIKRLCENGEFSVEANDLAAVTLMAERRLPFVAGPFLNLYHARALALVTRSGAYRWVPPVEMPGDALRCLLHEYHRDPAASPVETELFAYGRVPLAHSARCFTARAHGRNKDDCGFICLDHEYGVPLATREQQDFLQLNGIQVQSAAVHAIADSRAMQEAGVDGVRLVPANAQFDAVIRAYADASEAGRVNLPHAVVDGYWRGMTGMDAASGD